MTAATDSLLQAWMRREFALEGVLAAGGGISLSSAASAIANGEWVMAGDEKVWRLVADTIAAVLAQGMPTAELLWGYENAVLCTVLRGDGAWLGVFTAPKLSDTAAVALRTKLDAFKLQNFGL